MKKLLISIMGATLIPMSVAFADTTTKDSNWFEDFVGQYHQELNLTDAQKTQLRDIHQKHRLAEENEVKAVLTADQRAKWEELKTSRRDTYLDKNEKELDKN